MDITLLVAFVTTTLLFVAVPGPSVAFATAQALRHGKRGAIVTVAGDALGTIVHIAVAASSLGLLLSVSDLILPPLQIAGGIFVLYLAWRAFSAPHRIAAKPSDNATFWAGFFTCVSNPKAIAFFVALFPAFISTDHSVVLQSFVYGLIFILLDAFSILAFAFIAMAAADKAKGRWMRMEMLSGLGLAGVGIAMIIRGYRALPQN